MKLSRVLFTLLVIVLLASASSTFASDYESYIVKLAPEAEITPELCVLLTPTGLGEGVYLTGQPEAVSSFLAEEDIIYIEPNYVLDSFAFVPDDPLYTQQWALAQISVEAFYNGGFDGGGCTVAVIDSGLDIIHPEFSGISVSGCSRNFLGDARYSDAWDRDQKGHGTFVSGVIAAASGNGEGIASVTPGVEIMVLRCISYRNYTRFPYDSAYDANGGTVAVVAEAIRYAADNGADVINLSLGGYNVDTVTLQDAVNYANSNGVIVVAAAGNNAGTTLYYPAACYDVIGVGAVTNTGVRAYFSQYNSSVDVVAPGAEVLGIDIYPDDVAYDPANPDATYVTGSGTSFSAPVVSAFAAVCKQINPTLDGEDFLSLLALSSTDRGNPGRDDHYGYGLVNATEFLNALNASYSIRYELNQASAVLHPDTVLSYTLTSGGAISLKEPSCAGYVFDGWYRDASFEDGPVTQLEPGELGALTASGSGYAIAPITFYAKWLSLNLADVAAVTVKGYAAADKGGNLFEAVLPYGSVSGLDAINSNDIIITPRHEGAAVKDLTGSEGDWSFVVKNGAISKNYTLKIRLSQYGVPKLSASGTSGMEAEAFLKSLDGKKAARAAETDIASAFVNADSYTLVSCSSTGTVALNGSRLSYTPGDEDYEGQTLTILVRGSNADFAPEDAVVSVTVTISRQMSDAVVSLASADYDIYTGGSLTVSLEFWGNRFESVLLDGVRVDSGNWTMDGGSEEGGEISDSAQIMFKEAWLRQLAPGERSLGFRFSNGKTYIVTLNVSDSAPRYRARFFLESGGNPFHTIENIREGSAIGALPTPSKPGSTFLGWYTDLNDPNCRVTASSLVFADMDIYAMWRAGGGSGGGSGSGGGGLGGGGGSSGGGGDSGGGGASGGSPEAPGENPAEEQPETQAWEDVQLPFTDVAEDAYYRNAVAWAYSSEPRVTSGISESLFGPEYDCTRAQAVTFLWNVFGRPEPSASARRFSDVKEDDYFYKPVLWAAEMRITSGTSAENFSPGLVCSNAHILTFIYNALGKPGHSEAQEGGEWWEPAFNWAKSVGLIEGVLSEPFEPEAPCPRRNMVEFLFRYHNMKSDKRL